MPTLTSEKKLYERRTAVASTATSIAFVARRRRCAIATVTAAAAVAFCTSIPTHVNAFSTDVLPSTAARGPLHKTLTNPCGTSIITRTRLSAVTDPEVLLKDRLKESSASSKTTKNKGKGNGQSHIRTNGEQRNKKNGIGNGTKTRAQLNMQDLYWLETSYDLDSAAESDPKTNPSPKKNVDNSISKRISFAKRKPSARTSTMPGFRNKKTSQRHQSFRDGLSIAKRSNTHMAAKIHKVLHSEKEQKKRRKENSEAMYKGSATVPDSLIAFTREIHMVSSV